MLIEFEPQNEFEDYIRRAMSGLHTPADIAKQMLQEKVYVSSKSRVEPNGTGFAPLLVGTSDRPLVSVFTNPERPALHRDEAPFFLEMVGNELVRRMPPGYGIAVNPGFDSQLVISCEVIAELSEQSGSGA